MGIENREIVDTEGSRDCKQISNLYRLTQFRKTIWCFSYAWGIRWKVVVDEVVRWKKSSGRTSPPKKKSCPCTHVVKKPGTNFVRHEWYLLYPFMTIRTQLLYDTESLAFLALKISMHIPGSRDHVVSLKRPWNTPCFIHILALRFPTFYPIILYKKIHWQ